MMNPDDQPAALEDVESLDNSSTHPRYFRSSLLAQGLCQEWRSP